MPSRRTVPACGWRRPSISRSSVVLPEALGPIRPRHSPAANARLTLLMRGGRCGSVSRLTRSRLSSPRSVGNCNAGASWRSTPWTCKRRHAARTSTTDFQPAIRCSTGCRARPTSKVAAIMMPGDASPATTSQAPMPSIATCTHWRRMRPSADSVALAAPSRSWACCTCRCVPLHTATALPSMPMPISTSALRVSESMHCPAARRPTVTRSTSARMKCSENKPSANRAAAEIAAVSPSTGCSAKITSR